MDRVDSVLRDIRRSQALRDRRERRRVARALQGMRDEPRPTVESLGQAPQPDGLSDRYFSAWSIFV